MAETNAVLRVDDNHQYWLDGKPLSWPSPTVIMQDLRVIDYPQGEAGTATDYFKRRGSAVHLACYLDDVGELEDEEGLDPEIAIRLKRWRRFKKEARVDFSGLEEPLYSRQWQMVGCLDRRGVLRLDTEEKVLIDIKSGAVPSWTGIQTAFYELLLDDGYYHRYGVGLGTDPYTVKLFTDSQDRNVALAMLSTYRWKVNHKIIRGGKNGNGNSG